MVAMVTRSLPLQINLLYGEDDDEKVRPPLTIQPPSSPRPAHRVVKPKRASSIGKSIFVIIYSIYLFIYIFYF